MLAFAVNGEVEAVRHREDVVLRRVDVRAAQDDGSSGRAFLRRDRRLRAPESAAASSG